MIWVTGSTSIADYGIMQDIPLTNAMQLVLVSVCIPIDFKNTISQSSFEFTGYYHYKNGGYWFVM